MRSNSSGGLAGAVGRGVGDGELARHVRLQRRLRELVTEILEHRDRAVPLLEVDEVRWRHRTGHWGGSWSPGPRARRAGSPRPRRAGIARLELRLALLVDTRGEALGEIGAHLLVGAGELARLHECRLGLGVFALVIVRLRDDRPGNALLGLIHRRLAREDRLRDADGARTIAGGEDILGRVREHHGALGVLGEGLRELHTRIGLAGVPGVLGGAGEPLLAFLVGHERGVCGGGGLLIVRVVVGGVLVLGSPPRRTGGSRTAHPPAGSWSRPNPHRPGRTSDNRGTSAPPPRSLTTRLDFCAVAWK